MVISREDLIRDFKNKADEFGTAILYCPVL